MTKEKKTNHQRYKRLLVLLLFAILIVGTLFFGIYYKIQFGRLVNPTECLEVWIDTTLLVAEPLLVDTIPKKKYRIRKKDTLQLATLSRDSTLKPENPCSSDTIAPWVYPDPSGGLHYKALLVRFVSSKPCSISWRFGTEKEMKLYSTNDSITISTNAELYYQANDSCGNTMEMRCERYEISQPLTEKYCPPDMEYVKVGTMQYCIDRYEWPNKKDSKPQSNISIYHAIDSCFVAGKHLCTTDEWSMACAGPYSWHYPYGETYEYHACNSHSKTVQKTGSNPECRGYFGVYDMSGNLSEWTNTKSSKENNFYNVLGGFWESGSQSDCFSQRYSYYPQNAHNPVGFRCCKEIKSK